MKCTGNRDFCLQETPLHMTIGTAGDGMYSENRRLLHPIKEMVSRYSSKKRNESLKIPPKYDTLSESNNRNLNNPHEGN